MTRIEDLGAGMRQPRSELKDLQHELDRAERRLLDKEEDVSVVGAVLDNYRGIRGQPANLSANLAMELLAEDPVTRDLSVTFVDHENSTPGLDGYRRDRWSEPTHDDRVDSVRVRYERKDGRGVLGTLQSLVREYRPNCWGHPSPEDAACIV